MNSKRSNDAQPTSDSMESVYRSLLKLGLPQEITLNAFQRLYRGPMGEILLFVSEHVKGRQEVVEARSMIQRSREGKSKSLLKQPEVQPAARSLEDVAASRLRKAKKDMVVFGGELGEQLKVVEDLEQEISNLKRRALTKRRVATMLEALEDKERERMRRFEEMGILLKELKTKSPSPAKEAMVTLSSEPPIPPPKSQAAAETQEVSKLLRLSRTRDVLSNLEAYLVRLSRIAREDVATSLPELEAEFKKLVASKLGVRDLKDPEVDRVFHAFVRAARSKAQEDVQYKSYVHSEGLRGVTRKELQALASNNRRKQKTLQERADLSMGLAVASAHLADSLVPFQRTGVPLLRASLEEQSGEIRGYVDALRCHTVKEDREEEDMKSRRFEQEMKELLGIGRAATPGKVIEEIERLVRRAHEKQEYLAAVNIPSPPPPSDEEKEILASYESLVRDMEEKTEKLLTRKIAKAEMGERLVKDVEMLLKELNGIIGHGGVRR